MQKASITHRLLFGFALVSLVPLLGLGIALLKTFETQLRHTVIRDLSEVADRKADQINAYLSERVMDVRLLSYSPEVRQALTEFAQAMANGGPESAAYRQASQRYHDYFSYFVGSAGYYDVFLITITGDIVFTVLHEDDFATNLFDGPYRDTGLAHVVSQAQRLLETDFSNFAFYPPSNELAAFVAAPILEHGRLLGTVALQVDTKKVHDVVSDQVGLGDSGETIIARQELDRVHFVPFKQGLRDDQQPRILPILQHALRGERGSGVVLDSRHKKVVAAWRYLARPRWGMVVKIDAAEAFYMARRMWLAGSLVMLLVLGIVLVVAWYIGRGLVQPIKILTQGATALADGDLRQRVVVRGKDELSELALAFNKMAAHLQAGRDTLEQRVEERTVALREEIVERKRAEQDLIQAREAAETANRAKSAFIANMSHELRTPLNAVLGYAQLLLQNPDLSAEQQQAIKAIKRGGEYLLMLINDVLDLAKIEAGRFELFPTECYLPRFFEGLSEVFTMQAQQKGVAFHCETGDSLPNTVEIDEKRLRQVCMNLLGNAVKFTEQGEVRLSADYRDGHLHIEVSDTGIGIPPARRAQLFQAFTQVSDDRYKQQGTGLGLAISQNLVQQMGGEIQVSSREGEGSCFSFGIPAPARHSSSPEQAKTSAPAISAQEARQVSGHRRTDGETAPLRILITDDQAVNRLILRNLLKKFGLQAEEADSGEAAIAQATAAPPDLIFMDLVMPGLNGLDTTRQLLAHPATAEVPIIALSASTFEDDKQNSLAAGCREHLAKPVEVSLLLDALARYLPVTWVYHDSE